MITKLTDEIKDKILKQVYGIKSIVFYLRGKDLYTLEIVMQKNVDTLGSDFKYIKELTGYTSFSISMEKNKIRFY